MEMILQTSIIIGFVINLFFLYKLYVAQKDATIQLLTEKNNWLDKQLQVIKEKSPDILVEILSKRINYITLEIERLQSDSEKNESKILDKEKELETEVPPTANPAIA